MVPNEVTGVFKLCTKSRKLFAWASLLFATFLVYTDQHRFFFGFQYASWIAASLLVSLCLFGVWRLSLEHDEGVPEQAPRRWGPVHWTMLIVAIWIVRHWHLAHLADMRSLPIDSKYADMLPLLKAGFVDLDALRSPYRTHDVPWTLTNYYLPSTFAPYYLFHRLGLDIRWVNVLSMDLINLMVIFCGLAVRRRLELPDFIGGFAVVWIINELVNGYQLMRIIHLGPYWLYCTAAALSFLAQRQSWFAVFAVFAVLALTARETAVFVLFPLMLHTKPKTVLAIALACVGIFLPFAVDDPNFYAGNLQQYTSRALVDYMRENAFRFVGVSAMLDSLAFGWMRYPGFILAFIGILCLGWCRSLSPWASLGLAAWSCLLHALFALIAWNYLFVEGLLFLGIGAITARLNFRWNADAA